MSVQLAEHRRREPEAIHFRLLYAFCFGAFLITAVVQRVLPWRWFKAREGTARQSIVTQARNAASICATYAFMV